jgi:hypothetical protein
LEHFPALVERDDAETSEGTLGSRCLLAGEREGAEPDLGIRVIRDPEQEAGSSH